MNTTPYTIRLDAEVKAALETAADQEDRTPAQLATRAIKDMLAQKAAYNKAIDQALTEAEAGQFISSTSMHRWMDSWDTDNELAGPKIDITR